LESVVVEQKALQVLVLVAVLRAVLVQRIMSLMMA
jgi:hypothetical protein